VGFGAFVVLALVLHRARQAVGLALRAEDLQHQKKRGRSQETLTAAGSKQATAFSEPII
jgi:Arc/MetJ family transcription regulator